MSDKWFLVLGNKESGPYDLEHLRDLHLQGMLNQQSQLKTEAGEACTAADIDGLFGQPAADKEAAADAKAEQAADGEKQEFAVYSSDIKEPGMFGELMTPRNIAAAVFIGAWIIYGIAVSSYFNGENERVKKELDRIEAQNRMIEQNQRIQELSRPNISAEQIQQALQQSSPNY